MQVKISTENKVKKSRCNLISSKHFLTSCRSNPELGDHDNETRLKQYIPKNAIKEKHKFKEEMKHAKINHDEQQK